MLFKKKPASTMILSEQCPVALSDAYTDFRANLGFLTEKDGLKRIMIASAAEDEGKDTVAANLALSLAETGAKVVLLDADLRCSRLHKLLPSAAVMPATDLVSVLQADGEVRLPEWTSGGVCLLPAGRTPANPAVLLGSARMSALLDLLAARFDYVIVVVPPVTAAPDAALVGRVCDGTVLVVRYRATARRCAKEAVRRLCTAKVNLLGTVLSDTDLTWERKMGRPHVFYGNTEGKK